MLYIAEICATATNATPSATEPTCVTDGADGYCGTSVPAPGQPAPTADPILEKAIEHLAGKKAA